MMDLLQTLVSFVVALGVLVTIHEYGHYWVARRAGVRILRFSLGFGRPLYQRRFGPDATEFTVAAIPLGGYVKMLDEREGPVAPAERHRAFNNQSLPRRCAIVAAGPLANFLLAFLVYWAMFMAGVTGARPFIGEVDAGGIAARSGLRAGDEILNVDGRDTAIWDNVMSTAIDAILDAQSVRLSVLGADGLPREVTLDFSSISVDDISRGDFFNKVGFEPRRPKVPPIIGRVVPAEAAAEAGLQAGDRVLRLDGKPVDDWLDWVEDIRTSAGRRLEVVVSRDGSERTFTLEPRESVVDGRTVGRIGAEVAPFETPPEPVATATERYGMLTAAARALDRTRDVTLTTLKFLRKMVLGEASVNNLSGPISIAQFAGESAKLGLSRFLEFLGLVSVSLAVLNLLPIPMLDGGHLMYYLIESIIRKPVPEAVQLYGQHIGLMFLLGLMGLAIFNDIMRIL
jgi:regulator of sigma E protease